MLSPTHTKARKRKRDYDDDDDNNDDEKFQNKTGVCIIRRMLYTDRLVIMLFEYPVPWGSVTIETRLQDGLITILETHARVHHWK